MIVFDAQCPGYNLEHMYLACGPAAGSSRAVAGCTLQPPAHLVTGWLATPESAAGWLLAGWLACDETSKRVRAVHHAARTGCVADLLT